MKSKPLKIRSVTIGGKQPAFILGPCVIESEGFVWRMARKIAEICAAESVPFIFKKYTMDTMSSEIIELKISREEVFCIKRKAINSEIKSII